MILRESMDEPAFLLGCITWKGDNLQKVIDLIGLRVRVLNKKRLKIFTFDRPEIAEIGDLIIKWSDDSCSLGKSLDQSTIVTGCRGIDGNVRLYTHDD